MDAYFSEIEKLIQIVKEQESACIKEAAQIIVQRLQKGGIIQLFGCGHSQLLAQEAFYRAGGLVPVRPIFIEPLALHAGAMASSINEKDPAIIEQHKEQFDFRENDICIVISTSGRNSAPIDAALLAKNANVYVLSLQSLDYREQATRHHCGLRLEEVVDLVINTHIPIGDGVLHAHAQNMQYAPASTVIGSLLLNALFSEVIEEIAKTSTELPIFVSNNVDSDWSHNEIMIANYQDRIDFT
ncbi:sugar isomerase domain-containing protein [Lysinibacillus fusiformis]|uniref:sugar isomerase domain-containing protein n=1 Tax=Lysinibacillus fusiformis TaxID=28031 RepID=UPI00187EC090|nr:SIS domain-containing protein [Lysinibacillus fusiformis]MBD8522185.1 SIS domain-containing protein [Lysinibacillus fusiformis]